MILTGFIGPLGRQLSRNVDAEQTRNLYLEQAGAGTPKVPSALYGRPGLSPYVALYAGPVRGMLAQDGWMYAVGGGVLHEIFPSQTVTIRGSVALDANPATLSTNGTAGNQVLITSGGLVYIYDRTDHSLTLEAGPPFPRPILQGIFFQGYFIVMDAAGVIWWSTLEDGTEWAGLDFAQESQFSDTVVALTATHDQFWLYGTQHVSPWYNSGAPDIPFQPAPGQIMQVGTAAPFSASNIFNTAIWCGQNNDGSRIVYLANGSQPQRISTHAIEVSLSRVSADQLASSRGFTFQYLGHTFYGLYVPGLTQTLLYDLLTESWVEWSHWIPKILNWIPFVGWDHCFAYGQHLFGDRQNRAIYVMSEPHRTDAIYLPPSLVA